MTGDIGLLGGLWGLAYLSLYHTGVTGDVGGLRGLAALWALDLRGTRATGYMIVAARHPVGLRDLHGRARRLRGPHLG
jgi:hypothetical protein